MPHRIVHVGAGALGLGLTCWACHRLGLEIVVLNRFSNSNPRNDHLKSAREFTVFYPDRSSQSVLIADLFYVPTELPKAEALIQDPDTIILTTALKEYGIHQMVDTLRSLFKARAAVARPAPLLFIACENAISSRQVFDLVLQGLSNAEKVAIENTVHPLDCVVDRICNKPVLENGHLTVFCEHFAQWSIESSTIAKDMLGSYLHASEVELVDTIEPYVLRKKWIVNALHLSVAIAAHAQGHISIHRFLQDDDDARQLFEGLATELELMFDYWLNNSAPPGCFSAYEMTEFYSAVRERIMTHPQRVVDATTRLRRNMILDFIKDFNRKTVEPFLLYTTRSGESLYYVPFIIAQVDGLIAAERFID